MSLPSYKKYVLCFDDSGSRNPDKDSLKSTQRNDRMDWFALGGFLIKEEDIPILLNLHKNFCMKWNISYPLHSTKIRCHQGKFAWLSKSSAQEQFYAELGEFLCSLPILCTACVIHRPGYVIRYKDRYAEKLWLMCKTTFSILIERAAKYADSQDRKLEIVFEESGKKEDRDILNYLRELKKQGNPFNSTTSEVYKPLLAADYRRIIIGEPQRKTKLNPLLQIADLVLFPLVKNGYDSEYLPYKKLKAHNKLIDSHLSEEQLVSMAIKYSCFDEVKK